MRFILIPLLLLSSATTLWAEVFGVTYARECANAYDYYSERLQVEMVINREVKSNFGNVSDETEERFRKNQERYNDDFFSSIAGPQTLKLLEMSPFNSMKRYSCVDDANCDYQADWFNEVALFVNDLRKICDTEIRRLLWGGED